MKITVEIADTKFKPCSFCGGEAYIREEDIKGTAFVAVGAECKKCGARPFMTMIFEGEPDARKKAVAAKHWNKRVGDGR